ncbi:MAG: amidohydrolase family protein [Clostridiales bacterium]|nr:amidohydrolase family protein [Clostridiales bacterium]
MIIDSHQHVMLPTSMQIQKMDDAGVDKAILFTTTPHVERAETATLDAIGAEMQVLYQLLSGNYPPEMRMAKMKNTILELNQAIQGAPDRFYGFGPAPLGLSDQSTAEWVEEHIAGNGFKGIGEFTPGSETQIEQLEPIFKALKDYRNLPIWVHTFNPVILGGIKILMELCRKYPAVPVIFGHMGGSNWMDVIAFAKEHGQAYLDLSAAFTPLSVKTALTEVPGKCLFGSDAPFGEPQLCRQLIEFVSPAHSVTEMALSGNIKMLLQI